MWKSAGLLALALCGGFVSAQDVDVEQYVRKYWRYYQDKNVEVGSGDKRWPLTPELKAERLQYFRSALERFAPHHVAEASRIDRAFGWPDGTYLGILRFGAKTADKVPAAPDPSHECTSWIVMDDLTGGKSILMHKNRDSRGRPLALLRRAMPGKHAWIGNGSQYSFYPTQGINDRGVVVMMNSGDPLAEADNSQYGMSTGIICRILLEECGSAEEAVRLLEKIVRANGYTHVECGSIWFIGDRDNVHIVEHGARNFTAKPVNSGFAVRANAFRYPEMQIYSLRSHGSLFAHARRELAVRDFLVSQQWRRNGVITPLDMASSSRVDRVYGEPQCYPPCGKSTIAGTTFVIDREYPEILSSAAMVFASPKSSCYLPVPLTVSDIPEAILDGSYSMRAFERMDKKEPFLPAEQLAALEKRLYRRHAEAVEKARTLLRTGTAHNVREEAAKILNEAFQLNFEEILKEERPVAAPASK